MALQRGALTRALGTPLPAALRARLEAGPEGTAASAMMTDQTKTMTMTDEGGAGGKE
jgi:hypothetical protein